jgi:CAAX prenyl protease-like protein
MIASSKVLRALDAPATARVLPFALFMAFIIVDGQLERPLQSFGFDARWLYAARAVAVTLALIFFARSYIELRSLPRTDQRLLLSIAAGVAVFGIWINLDQSWAVVGTPGGFNPLYLNGDGIDWRVTAFRIAGMVIVVPIMEELFWRSFLLRWIDDQNFLRVAPGDVSLRAHAITAVLFALEHNLWLAGLIAGIVYNWIYAKTGNLWCVIVAHGVTNGVLAWYIVHTGEWQFW